MLRPRRWLTGLVLDWTGLEAAGLVAHVLGLAAGARTFVPGALRRLVRGHGHARLGVGLLMTIAATGAVLLGHVGEAAALAFLFSIAETLEDRAMDRARRGPRALLSLIPETARVTRRSGERRFRLHESASSTSSWWVPVSASPPTVWS